MANPFPNLRIWPTSGLTFAWAEHHPGGTVGSLDANLGPDGAVFTMQMLIFWQDLALAMQELLGFSFRNNVPIPPIISRVLPWQHPLANQLWVRNISSIKGIRLEGDLLINFPGGGAGPGYKINLGPWSTFHLAQLTIQFWRPPYYLRSDSDISDPALGQMEWLRFLDKNWEISTSMLAREYSTFQYGTKSGAPTLTDYHVPVGQRLSHMKVKRRWYQIPEQCLFNPLTDRTPNGLPRNLLYTQTSTSNPITDYVQPAGLPIGGCVNAPIGGAPLVFDDVTITSGSATISGLVDTSGLDVGFYCDGPFIPPGSKIVSVDNPDEVTLDHTATDNGPVSNRIVFEDPDLQFLGFPMGTLLLEGVELIPRPLQMPAFLMQIPFFNGAEPIAQQQYDVVFHFDYFDPPRSPNGYSFRGHNLMPNSTDNCWYAVVTQGNVGGTTTPTTAFQYADFSDLFKVL